MREDEPPELSPEEQRCRAIERNKQKLAHLREIGELESNDYNLSCLWYQVKNGEYVTRKDIGNHAIVITQEQLKGLGSLLIIGANGKPRIIYSDDTGYEPDDILIIFPEELGDKEL